MKHCYVHGEVRGCGYLLDIMPLEMGGSEFFRANRKAHGGKIEVHSEPGQGSTVTVLVPFE